MAAGGLLVAVLVAALPHGAAFNILPAPHRVLTHGGSRSFGYRVLQLHGSRVLVAAPEGPGRLFQCHVGSGACEQLGLPGNSSHLGLALARDGNHSIVCGPGLTRECDRNVYTSGLCVLLDPDLKPQEIRAPGYQGCLRGLVDLVFLFDGSNSMNSAQFGAIWSFMVDVMEKLENTSIHFGAVQFSTGVRLHFTLGDFASRPRPRELLGAPRQLRGLTDTFAAIAYVTRSIFREEQGARPGAKRVLIIITDGDATDNDTKVIEEAEELGIIRYIIGVGNNFNSPNTRRYLSQFASSPSAEFVKVLDSFEKLQGLFQELQAKIYDIEGTSDLNRFHLELCSSGMSVGVVHGHRVTGAVGADNWAGGLVEMEPENETFVANPALQDNVTDAYLGYSLATLHLPAATLVAAGAPRHLHVGAVVLFEVPEATGSWRLLQTLLGEQVGSYFGATLCALDHEEKTVALLVGAPNHYDGRRGGRVLLHRWEKETLVVTEELLGAPGHPLGRFGASVVALGDLDGDGWPEVAVGAPLEDEERGAVYIFSGREGGVENVYSQRLEGQEVTPGLRFFGQALDGVRDVTGDGLVDLAVGTHGAVAVLRSLPTLRPSPTLSASPSAIPSRDVDCGGGAGARLTLRLCPRPNPPRGVPPPPLRFRVLLEPQRARGRGGMGAGLSREWAGRSEGAGPECLEEELLLPPCLDDTISPLRLAAALSLPHGAGAVLRPPSPSVSLEIPFEQSCGADGVCQADVGLEAVAVGRGLPVGRPAATYGARLVLRNRGDDAYGAALQVGGPEGLALRRARAWRDSVAVSLACGALPDAVGQPWGAVGQPWGLACSLGSPVLRAGWQLRVELTFDVLDNVTWGDAVGLTAAVTCDNEAPGAEGDNNVTWTEPLNFHLGVLAAWDEAAPPHLNFSSRSPQSKTLRHRYRLETLQPPPHSRLPPSLTALLLLPHTLPHGIDVVDPQVRMEPGGACEAVGQEGDEAAMGQELNRSLAEGCPSPHGLRLFRCGPSPLPPPEAPAFVVMETTLRPSPTLQGPAHFRFCSALRLVLAPRAFGADPEALGAQALTELELLSGAAPVAILVGGGAGGLLLLLLLIGALAKCGFFRRGYRQRLEGEGLKEGSGPEVEGPEVEGAGPEVEGEGPEVEGEEPEDKGEGPEESSDPLTQG